MASSDEHSTVRTRVDGDGVAWIELHRPEAMNAITLELATALEVAVRSVAAEGRVIVLRGAGGNFSVGGDFNYLSQVRTERPEEMVELFEQFGRTCRAIGEVRVPVVAAVEGFAVAGGFELMQAADIVVVRDDARIGDNHARFAMVPGGGSSQRLPRLVGRQRALSLLLTGDHISGAEAVRWGLAYLSASPEQFDHVLSGLVQTLASKDRHVLGVIKGLVRDHLDDPLETGLGHELEAVLEHLSAPSGGQGIESFSERGEGTPR